MLLKDMNPRARAMVIKAIRDAFKMSDTYTNVKKRARVEKPRYKKDGSLSKVKNVYYRCEGCGDLFKEKDIQLDHRRPVVATYSSTSLMTIQQYYSQVFCLEANMQVLCASGDESCHSKKTKAENVRRKKTTRTGDVLKKYKKKPSNTMKSKKKIRKKKL